jgi:hypothetical protein
VHKFFVGTEEEECEEEEVVVLSDEVEDEKMSVFCLIKTLG